MRSYSTVKGTYWNGATGRLLRAAGKDAQLLGAYLMTCPMANVLGLYYLPLVVVKKEVALSLAEIVKAFDKVKQADFASYDDEAEMVWVHEMLKHQFGEQVTEKDHRAKPLKRMYLEAPATWLLGPFHDRYGMTHGLGLRREGAPYKGLQTPRKGLVLVPDPDPVLLEEERKRSEAFEMFWTCYPRKDGKKAAREVWERLKPDHETQLAIQADVEKRRRSQQWLKEGGQFVPHAKTYLHGKRWEDGFEEQPALSDATIRVFKGGMDYASGE